MKTDISRLDEKPSGWMLSTSRGLAWACGMIVAVAIGAVGFGFAECELGSGASQSEVRVVRASVTWQEGGRELSVIHAAEPVQEAAPRVVEIEHGERRTRFDEPATMGREIRTGVAVVTMLVRLLASGKMDG
jgi:hypothetical protein